jgi:RimJ/RimL family protein N-acetyltransferase
VLLRPEFLTAQPKVVVDPDIKTVFVCFGGSDTKNLTHTVTKILVNDNRFKKIVVVIGSEYSYTDNLNALIKNNPKIYLYKAVDAATLSALIADCNIAIVPASGILLEVLAIGTKAIAGMYIDNQKNIFNNYKALGAFESAEYFAKNDLLTAINNAVKNKGRPDKKIIDGKSGERLLHLFTQLNEENKVVLRNARDYDIDKTFAWANNREIRKFSFNSDPVEYAVHEKWFTDKINDINCFYYLGELDNQLFGSVRFDIIDNNAKISYLIDPLYQKRGLGTVLLKKGLNLFIQQSAGDVLAVYGDVFFEIKASVKVFEKLGYTVKSDASTNIVRFNKIINI